MEYLRDILFDLNREHKGKLPTCFLVKEMDDRSKRQGALGSYTYPLMEIAVNKPVLQQYNKNIHYYTMFHEYRHHIQFCNRLISKMSIWDAEIDADAWAIVKMEKEGVEIDCEVKEYIENRQGTNFHNWLLFTEAVKSLRGVK